MRLLGIQLAFVSIKVMSLYLEVNELIFILLLSMHHITPALVITSSFQLPTVPSSTLYFHF